MQNDNLNRVLHTFIGLLTGLALGYLLEDLNRNKAPHMTLLAVSAVIAFGTTLLAQIGPLKAKAFAMAAVVTLILAGSLYWASTRFETFSGGNGMLMQAQPVLLALALIQPFGQTYLLSDKHWRSYTDLHDAALSLFMRILVSWAFSVLFWTLYLLSDVLFQLIGLSVLNELSKNSYFASGLSGLVFGLAMAVTFELDTVIITLKSVAVRLLRLLLPVVFVVTLVFVIGLLLQGFEGAFRRRSAAATMMSVVLLGVAFIAAMIDSSDNDASNNPIFVWSARGLSLLVLVLAGLSVYAIALRVGDYGWTPERVASVLVAVIVLAYAIVHAVGAISPEWRARIRAGNIWVALGIIATCILWQTPLINAQRISVKSQITRFDSGAMTAAQLPLYELKFAWGRVGGEAYAELDIRKQTDAELERAIDKYRLASDILSSEVATTTDDQLVEIERMMPVIPLDAGPLNLSDPKVSGLYVASEFIDACNKKTVSGKPACVALVVDFITSNEGLETIILLNSHSGLSIYTIIGNELRYSTSSSRKIPSPEAREIIDQVHNGDFSLVERRHFDLQIGDTRVILPTK